MPIFFLSKLLNDYIYIYTVEVAANPQLGDDQSATDPLKSRTVNAVNAQGKGGLNLSSNI